MGSDLQVINDITFALDVGGTSIKACVLEQSNIIEETVSIYDSCSNQDKEAIIQNFADIIEKLSVLYKKYLQNLNADKSANSPFSNMSIGVGFAFPGPFDYEKGISYIKGLNKFESIYGVSIYENLLKKLKYTELGIRSKVVNILFENDARLFGLGVSTVYPEERLICLTIGTGLGSSFLEYGKLLKDDRRIPPGGYLYNQIYNHSYVDDLFSKRGIIQSAVQKNTAYQNMDVKELAKAAKEGNKELIELFEQFGEDLGRMLIPFIRDFEANRIVVGGQIAKSIDLFGESMKKSFIHLNTDVTYLDNAVKYTFIGIAKLFER